MEEITATYKRELVRWSDQTAVLECKFASGGLVTVICDCERGDLDAGTPYRFSGEYKTHRIYGQQFRASLFCPDIPITEMETRRYLQKFPGIGWASALKLWDTYGAKCLEALAADFRILYSYKIKEAPAREISAQIRNGMETARTKIALASYLAGHHFPRTLTEQVFKLYGAQSLQALTVNPYLLLKFERCGFPSVDAFALEKGFNPLRLKRQALFLLYQMENSGDVWFQKKQLEVKLKDQFGSHANIRALELLSRSHKIRERDIETGKYIAAESDASDEETILAEVQEHLEPNYPIRVNDSDLSESQRVALARAISMKIGCFTGGPGTGKTYSVARYIQAIVEQYGSENVCVVAPTGKAVVRSREMLASIGVRCDARTIHSLLLAQENEFSNIRYQFIISDESSMIDAGLMRRFLVHNRDSSILFVGDDGQLLPVGKGRPFADFLEAGLIPVGRLTETRRNSGQIVTACHAIRNGVHWLPSRVANLPEGRNLVYIPSGDFLATIRGILVKFPGVDLVKMVQVIAGLNGGENGIVELNQALRPIMNPKCDPKSRYDVGDPVICLKNASYCDAADVKNGQDEGSVYVSNGEIGQCIDLEYDKQTGTTLTRVIVDFGNERKVRFKPSNLSFNLAYAVTCHKMQGSETPVAIVLLDPSFSAKRVCTREWLYTAISRAKKLCFLVGNIETAHAFSWNIGARRVTFLARDMVQIKRKEKYDSIGITEQHEFDRSADPHDPGRNPGPQRPNQGLERVA